MSLAASSTISASASAHQHGLQNSGTIELEDADILITLTEPRPTADYVKTLREQLPAPVPGTSFAFLPADIVSQILNFGVPAPMRPAGGGQ